MKLVGKHVSFVLFFMSMIETVFGVHLGVLAPCIDLVEMSARDTVAWLSFQVENVCRIQQSSVHTFCLFLIR